MKMAIGCEYGSQYYNVYMPHAHRSVSSPSSVHAAYFFYHFSTFVSVVFVIVVSQARAYRCRRRDSYYTVLRVSVRAIF